MSPALHSSNWYDEDRKPRPGPSNTLLCPKSELIDPRVARVLSWVVWVAVILLLMTVSLAFLAPGLVKTAAEGRLPRGIGVSRLFDPPAEWSRQFRMLGLTS